MNDYRSVAARIKGPLVPIAPAFREGGTLDLESTCAWVDWLVNSGIKLFWTTYGTSHYKCLSDREIMDLTEAVAQVTRDRAIFIASTNYHWPASQCASFLEFASQCGVDIVKLQIGWRWDPPEDMVFEFYRGLADVSPLPLFAYTHVARSSSGMSSALLARILHLPQFVGMKNDSGDFYEHCEYLRTIRLHAAQFVPMTGGSMMSFLHGRAFGAQAFATAVGMYAPEVPIAFMRCLDEGRPDEAVELIREREQPLLELESLPCNDHRAVYHTILMLCGHFRTNAMRFPTQTCDENAVHAVRSFLCAQGIL